MTLRDVGPVLSNSMFMVLPFITHTDGAAQATSTRKYHHAPSLLLIGALLPSLWGGFSFVLGDLRSSSSCRFCFSFSHLAKCSARLSNPLQNTSYEKRLSQ